MRRLTGLEQFAQLVSRSCWLLAKWPLNWYIPGPSMLIGLERILGQTPSTRLMLTHCWGARGAERESPCTATRSRTGAFPFAGDWGGGWVATTERTKPMLG